MSNNKIEKFIKKIFVSFILVGLGFLGLVFAPTVQAVSGYNIGYIDDGGATPDVFLNSPTTSEAVLGIEAVESVGTGNQITAITLEIMDTTGPNGQMTGFINTDLAEIALYQDNGTNNGQLDGSDTLLATSDPGTWTPLTNPTRWQHTFSGLTVPIPTSYSSTNPDRILVVARAKDGSLDATPLKGFHFQIQTGGVAVSVSSGASLTNFPSGTDMFFSGPVWLGQEGAGNFGSPIVISEVQTSGDGANAPQDEFVELYNRTPDPFDLSGFKLVYNAPNATSSDNWLNSAPLSGTIPANGFFLITNQNGYNGTTAPNNTYNAFSLDETGGYVAILDPSGSIMDLVGYGNLTTPSLAEGGQPAPAPSQNGSIERKAFPDSTASKMASGGIDADQGNKEDTNYNAGDFVVQSVSNPQNASSTTEAPGGGPGTVCWKARKIFKMTQFKHSNKIIKANT